MTGVLSAAARGNAPDAGVVAGYLLIVAAVGLFVLASTGRIGRFDAYRAAVQV